MYSCTKWIVLYYNTIQIPSGYEVGRTQNLPPVAALHTRVHIELTAQI